MNPSEFEEHCSRAKELQDKNDWENAIKEYERALEIIPDDKDIIASLGFCYSRNRDYKKAIELYLNLINLDLKSAKWPYMVGYQFYAQSNWSEAISYFDKSLALKHY
jgi:tetratricopeptide (TPR) repeat protein